jgi:hypothetical protein
MRSIVATLVLVALAVPAARRVVLAQPLPPSGGRPHLRPIPPPPTPPPTRKCAAALNQTCSNAAIMKQSEPSNSCTECTISHDQELRNAGNCSVSQMLGFCTACQTTLGNTCGEARNFGFDACVECMLTAKNSAAQLDAGCLPADRGEFCQRGTTTDTVTGLIWPPYNWDPCVGPWPPPAWTTLKQAMYSGMGSSGSGALAFGSGQQLECPSGSIQEGLYNNLRAKTGLLASADSGNKLCEPPCYNPDVLPTSERCGCFCANCEPTCMLRILAIRT